MKKLKISFVLFFIICLILSGKEVRELIDEGIFYLRIGDYENSIKIFENAKKMSPENPDIYHLLGEAYFYNGEIQKAITNLQKAIEMNDKNPSYYYTIALVYLSQNKNKEALEALEKVIKISPLSIYGKSALKIKQEIENENYKDEIVKRWEKIENEEKIKREELKKIRERTSQEEISPAGEIETLPKEEKIPIVNLIKRLKYGTDAMRINSSNLLIKYSAVEINSIVGEILEMVKKEENPEIKRNLIIALGKVKTPEVINVLLNIIKDENELFEIKIIALDVIETLQSEKVVSELRTILSQMVEKREKEREEARKNIEKINQDLDDLIVKRLTLNNTLQDLNSKKSQIDGILGGPSEMMGPEMPPGMIPPGGPAVAGGRRLTEREYKQMLEERRKLEDRIKQTNEELEKINKQIDELNLKKRKYEELLAIKGRKIDITSLSSSAVVTVITERPREIGPPAFPEGPGAMMVEMFSPSQRETDEEKNEIIFAVKLIKTLGELRDKNSISLIKKAWKEFGVPGLEIYYLIALGKLGEFTNINLLVNRLKRDIPQGNIEEVNIRKNIIEVLGEYLKINPNENIKGLIEFLAEESEYPEIKNAAQKVSFTIKQGS